MQASQWECECVCFLCFHQKKERWESQETSDSKLAFDSIIESSRIYWALTLCMQINRIKMWPTHGLCCSNLQLNEADKLAHGIIIQDRFFSWKRRRGKKEGIKEGKEERNEERIRQCRNKGKKLRCIVISYVPGTVLSTLHLVFCLMFITAR